MTIELIEAGTPDGVLTVDDVIRIFHEEATRDKPGARAVRASTIYMYLYHSRSSAPDAEPRRYAANPMPAPRRMTRNLLWWGADQEQELRDWWNSRPGLGHGTGGRRAGR